jgi:hypothetical protein
LGSIQQHPSIELRTQHHAAQKFAQAGRKKKNE